MIISTPAIKIVIVCTDSSHKPQAMVIDLYVLGLLLPTQLPLKLLISACVMLDHFSLCTD